MKPKWKFLTRLSVGLFGLVFYCEVLVFYFVQMNCSWPQLNNIKSDVPVKIMVIADTHLLGSRNGHWFDKLRREWQMYRAFQTAITLHNPELVFVLGDLLDEGDFCSDNEFNYYINRFHSLFHVPETIKMYFAVGNHDIGFHHWVTPHRKKRFEQGFKTPPVQLVSVRGVHFVLVNSMALEGDGCFLCRPAEEALSKIETRIKCTGKALKGASKCNNVVPLESSSRPILMQHYPLYRESDMICNDFDAAPLPERQSKFRETWECLSKEATYQLLKQVGPRLVLSGHTHHGCTRKLPFGNGTEISIPSFSWRNKDNPNYGLGVFSPEDYAFSKCEMPKESTVINLYIGGVILLFIWIIYNGRKLKLV